MRCTGYIFIALPQKTPAAARYGAKAALNDFNAHSATPRIQRKRKRIRMLISVLMQPSTIATTINREIMKLATARNYPLGFFPAMISNTVLIALNHFD
jgi:hypothetical protein